jgi:hypothetical protein
MRIAFLAARSVSRDRGRKPMRRAPQPQLDGNFQPTKLAPEYSMQSLHSKYGVQYVVIILSGMYLEI